MKIVIIRNPVAGGAGAGARFDAGLAILREHAVSVDILETRDGDDAALLARGAAERADLLIAAGGDGTISNVVEGILTSARPDVAMSVMPLGTGSDFVRNFQTPDDPVALARSILAAPVRAIDAARLIFADGLTRHFANVVSAGVSAMVARGVNGPLTRRYLPRSLRFPAHSVREILRYRPQAFRVAVDGREVHAGPVTAVAIANGGWFGGGMRVMPPADTADGVLDVGILRSGPPAAVLGILRRLYSGAHIGHPLVEVTRGRVVELEPLDAGDLPIDVDGETPCLRAFRAEILPGALNFKL